ncbi:unnamed protein product [Pocillopora meandrina]|uniref:Integrase p58-like C-terminal domain-containing protein n=1 Tax=Pocillopora meandrina TaxID=46732 RepID=A0AAU9WGY8_9CNID|nr:unnamed protein product [Pocillopora meandrina]
MVSFTASEKPRMDKAHEKAQEHLRTSQKRQKDCYDCRVASEEITVRDHMYLYVPVIKNGKKLHSPWQGLHVVVKKIGDMTFQVEEVGNHRKRKVVNFNRLKLCGEPPSANQYPVPLSAYWSLLQFTSAETASSPLVHIG